MMIRPGRHRIPRPTRILALVLAVLVTGGIVLVTGTASARGGRGAAEDRAALNDYGRKHRGKNRKDKENVEFPGRDKAGPADGNEFVDIREVTPGADPTKERRAGSSGSFLARCGTNENGHRNSDNYMVTPGKRNGAQHIHDYVGNLSTNAFSDDRTLHAAGTTCDRNNQSTFFWPVLRDIRFQDGDVFADGGGKDGNFGRILRPASAELRFLGSATGKVISMPDNLMIITGDAKARTNGKKNANAKWSCTGFTNRITDKYPLCPEGSRLMRILDFPSCWDGRHLDSKDHRSHVIFPRENGRCKRGFRAIPQLRVTLTYDRPHGRDFAVDTFPDQRHDPRTDHSDFENIASREVLDLAADCINSGRDC